MQTSLLGTASSFNKEGYMTDLNSLKVSSTSEITDLKKARTLLKSVITSNPKSASGWIAAARVEELDGKVDEARAIINNACRNFFDNEDIWLESARLNDPSKTKTILG
jgi:pre-mRNA-processing factor 6